jgi:head-tail adaptor
MANINTALQNAMAEAFATRFPAGSVLEIRSATKPATANVAASGTLGASIVLPASPWAAASGGAVTKSGTWEDASADNSITATWARLRNAADTERMDFTAGASGSGAEVQITVAGSPSAAITQGGAVTISSVSISMPAG